MHSNTPSCIALISGTFGRANATRLHKKLIRLPNIGAAVITASIHGWT